MGKVIDFVGARQLAACFAERIGEAIASAATQEELDDLDRDLMTPPRGSSPAVLAQLDADLARRRRALRSAGKDSPTGGRAA